MSRRILFIDDDIASVSAARRALTAAGFKPALATNGSDAEAVLEHDEPHLVLLALETGGGQGLGICRALRDRAPDPGLPILLIGRPDDRIHDTATALAAGADGFFARPVDWTAVVRKIEAYLGAAAEAAPRPGPTQVAAAAARAESRDDPDEFDLEQDMEALIADDVPDEPARPIPPVAEAAPAPSTAWEAEDDEREASLDELLAETLERETFGEAPEPPPAELSLEPPPEAAPASEWSGRELPADWTRAAPAPPETGRLGAGWGGEDAPSDLELEADREDSRRTSRLPDVPEVADVGDLVDAQDATDAAVPEEAPDEDAWAMFGAEEEAPEPGPEAPPEVMTDLLLDEDALYEPPATRAGPPPRPQPPEAPPAPAEPEPSAPPPETPPAPAPRPPQPEAPPRGPEPGPRRAPPEAPPRGPEPTPRRAPPEAPPRGPEPGPRRPPPELAGAPEPTPAPQPTEPPFAATGELAERDVPHLLAELYRARATGALELESAGGVRRRVFVELGRPVGVWSDAAQEQLGEVAFRLGRITRNQVRRLAAEGPPTPRRQAVHLVESGQLKPHELYATVRAYAEEALFGAIAVEAGTWRWVPVTCPDDERVAHPDPPYALVTEGIRRKLTLPRLHRRLGGPATVLAPIPGADLQPLGLTARERRLAEQIDGTRTAEELVFLAGLGEEATWQVLYALVVAGVAEPRLRGPLSEAAAPAPDRAETDRRIDRERIEAKFRQAVEADYFEILGVPPEATGYEIRAAYERLSREFHPSRYGDPALQDLWGHLEEIRRALDDAWDVLRDEGLREDYVAALRPERE